MQSIKKISVTCLLALMALTFSQFTVIGAASAAEGDAVDVGFFTGWDNATVSPGGELRNTWGNFCVSGTGIVSSITLDVQTTNFDLTGFTVQEANQWNTATDLGSITNNVWTGQIQDQQCLAFQPVGTVTGEDGESASWTATVVSSTLLDSSPNPDPYNGNDTDSVTVPIVISADLFASVGLEGATSVGPGLDYTNVYINLCSNVGSSPVKEITFSATADNVSLGQLSVAPWTTATDHGSVSNGVWTGQLDGNQCVMFEHTDVVTGSIGQDASWTLTILSSVLINDEVNIDSNSGNETTSLILPIEQPELNEDLWIYVEPGAHSVASGAVVGIWHSVCTQGYGVITNFTLDIDSENMQVLDYEMGTSDDWNTADDMGSFTGNVWTGQLDRNQCVGFSMRVSVTGQVGDTASITSSIISSSFANDVENIDPDESDNSGEYTMNVVVAADIAVTTRLMTSGEIHSGSNVSYEVDFMNVGAGVLHEAQVGLFYLLPEGATFTSIEDLDLNDILSPTDPDQACVSVGLIQNMGPAFSLYVGEVIQCSLTSSTGNIQPGSSYPFQINMTASESFATGSTQVLGVALANGGGEPDSSAFIFAITRQQDAFSLPINNISHLTYDGNPLVVTVNPCAGQGAEVTVDDACFTISFNKPVWAPTFTAEDVLLDGTGTVSSLVKDSSTQWTIHVTGMVPGGTLRILLNEASVSDYSAVSNGVSVLGENVVRFALAGDASSETNSPSGSDADSNSSGAGSVASDDEGVAAQADEEARTLKGVGSGVVGFTQRLANDLANSDLMLGAWSLMHSNTLDVVIVFINIAGAVALCFIIRARRKRVNPSN